MIIQINATVCAAVIMVSAGSARSLAETSGKMVQKARKGPVTRQNDESKEPGKVPVFAANAERRG